MFASKTTRDLNRRNGKHPFGPDCSDKCRADAGFAQHNEPNPILVNHRKYRAEVVAAGLDPIQEHLEELEILSAEYGSNSGWVDDKDQYHPFTPAQIDHARKVLERLARL